MKEKENISWPYEKDGTVTTYEPLVANTKPKTGLPDLPTQTFLVQRLWASELQKPTSKSSLDVPTMQGISDPVQLVETCVERARQYLANKDPMQASEKVYKAAEESIKILADYHGLNEVQEAKDEGQWWIKLLNRASMNITKKTGKHLVDDAWGKAYRAHVFGFHENAYSIEDIKPVLVAVEQLAKYVREVADARRKNS